MIVTQSDSPDDHRRVNRTIAERLADDLEMLHNIPAWVFQERFPEWLAINPAQFQGILRRLRLMAGDPFDHELTPLNEWVLYYSPREWLEFAEEREAEGDDPANFAEYREEIELALEVASDWDVLMLPELVKALQQGGGLLDELGVDLADYAELLPEDMRERVEAQLKAKSDREVKDQGSRPNTPP